MPGKAETMQVDMIACAGHGVCAELLPEWIRLDDLGVPDRPHGGHPAGADGPGQVGGVELPGPRPEAAQEGLESGPLFVWLSIKAGSPAHSA